MSEEHRPDFAWILHEARAGSHSAALSDLRAAVSEALDALRRAQTLFSELKTLCDFGERLSNANEKRAPTGSGRHLPPRAAAL